MPTFKTVEAILARLPEIIVGERFRRRTWFVHGKAFAWERPFSKADIRRFGDQTPPDGPILAVSTADLAEKEAILATASSAVFTIAHFDGYPAVLIQLNQVEQKELEDLISDAWFACAPPALAEQQQRGSES